MRRALATLALAVLATFGCHQLTGSMRPVPPVHRVPIAIEGTVILLGDDAEIETRDPVHISRAKDARIPQDLRASMTTALSLAGFKVVTSAAQPHELVAKIALAVREEKSEIYQTYRCGLRGRDGTEVAQIDWAWPKGTYVAEDEVLDYATHNVATEVAMSPRVLGYLRGARAGAGAGAAAGDAGTAPGP